MQGSSPTAADDGIFNEIKKAGYHLLPNNFQIFVVKLLNFIAVDKVLAPLVYSLQKQTVLAKL